MQITGCLLFLCLLACFLISGLIRQHDKLSQPFLELDFPKAYLQLWNFISSQYLWNFTNNNLKHNNHICDSLLFTGQRKVLRLLSLCLQEML